MSYALFEGRPLTTRGQWINSLVFTHFAIEKRLPAMKKVEKPVFILGTGRSGTTILGIVLSMHREVGFLNEPKALWHSICQDEDLIGSYSRGAATYRLERNDATEEMRQAAKRLYGAYLRATFSGRVVDKYPELIFRVPFVKEIFPDAKFLFLVRNGWDTCHSIEGWSNRLGQEVSEEIHDWWGVDNRKWHLLVEQLVPEHADLAPYADEMKNWTSQTDMAAVEWIVTMREGLKLLERHPDDIVRVNYESMCVSPREELAKIVSATGLAQKDEKFYQYAEETLQVVNPKAPFALHQGIQDAFHETMEQLGYAK
jgi:hypothetical protein